MFFVAVPDGEITQAAVECLAISLTVEEETCLRKVKDKAGGGDEMLGAAVGDPAIIPKLVEIPPLLQIQTGRMVEVHDPLHVGEQELLRTEIRKLCGRFRR